MSANRETSSSTGIVFAKAKSEWVIPQRAKPGRKSSKAVVVEPAQSKPTPAVSASSSSSGSRDAQRAFRERKTEYVASLEARIESFEKGEIQRNVALQTTARGLKDENTRFKCELSLVRRELSDREKELRGKEVERQGLEDALREMRGKLGGVERLVREAERRGYERGRREALGSIAGSSSGSHERREGTNTFAPGSRRPSGSGSTSLVAQEDGDEDEEEYKPRMMVLSSGSPSDPTKTYTPSPTQQDQSRPRHSHSQSQSQSLRMPSSDDDVDSISRQVAMDMACGFCEGIESVCVCRIVREEERNGKNNHYHRSDDNEHVDDGNGNGNGNGNGGRLYGGVMGIVNPVTKQLSPTYHAEITAAVRSTSILDNLPPVQAAVPLRRRRPNGNVQGDGSSSFGIFGVKKVPIFAVSPAVLQDGKDSPSYVPPPAECSGDPRNCSACKDDDFGREFCESLSKSLCNNEPGHRCDNCPGEQAIKASATAMTAATSVSVPKPITINRARSSTTSVSSVVAPVRSHTSDKTSSSPTDIEAEYLDIKCCGNSEICGTLDKNCGDDEIPPGHTYSHEQRPQGSESVMPTGTWEEKISQLAPHGHEVDVTLSADEAWKTLKAHPNAKFASLAMLADVVARGTKCIGQPGAPSPSPRLEKPDPFASLSIPKPRPVEQPTSTGSKRRRFEVQSYAVKEALAVLDAHPNHPLKKRRLSDLRGT